MEAAIAKLQTSQSIVNTLSRGQLRRVEHEHLRQRHFVQHVGDRLGEHYFRRRRRDKFNHRHDEQLSIPPERAKVARVSSPPSEQGPAMPPSARESYQAAEITTASPQKLQLLLIEAALRSAAARRPAMARRAARGCLSIAAPRPGGGDRTAPRDRSAVARGVAARAAAVYAFIFRRLAECGFQRDEEKLAEAIRLLEFERETWRQVCQQARDRRIDPAGSLPPPAARTSLPRWIIPIPSAPADCRWKRSRARATVAVSRSQRKHWRDARAARRPRGDSQACPAGYDDSVVSVSPRGGVPSRMKTH